MNFEPLWVFVGLDSDAITDLSLFTDACLRCQTEGKQEECVGKKLTLYSEALHYTSLQSSVYQRLEMVKVWE